MELLTSEILSPRTNHTLAGEGSWYEALLSAEGLTALFSCCGRESQVFCKKVAPGTFAMLQWKVTYPSTSRQNKLVNLSLKKKKTQSWAGGIWEELEIGGLGMTRAHSVKFSKN